MMAILTIARLTVAEAARRRILVVLLGLTLVSVALTTLGVERLVTLGRASPDTNELEIQVGVSQILILVAFMFSFVLAMTAAFLAAPAIAADLETGVAHALLARPIRRADYVIGRWIGLVAIVAAYAAGSGLLEIAAVRLVTGYAPPQPPMAVAFLSAQAIVLLTLALLCSTRLPAIAAGAICVVVYGLGWMAGVFAGIGRVFEAGPLVAVAEASRWLLPSDGLWRGTIYSLEPPAVVLVALGRGGPAADANPFFASSPPPLPFLAWSVAWIVLVLALTVISLDRRDL
jgi:ABC-type transport system involved in multi-copper enzyme maturation permease subunit